MGEPSPNYSLVSRPAAGTETTALWTIPEFACHLRISRATAWRLLARGAVARTRVGGRTFVRRADAEAFVESNREGTR